MLKVAFPVDVRSARATGGFAVRTAPFDPASVEIQFFDERGVDIGPGIQRQLERAYYRDDLRRAEGEMAADTHDGESTAALRLIDRLHGVYGQFIDLFVLDALDPTGPVMTRLTEHGYGAVITVKKRTDEPLKEALALMHGQPPCCVCVCGARTP